ncbi:MAG: outer membrane beta-barrel protein [Planctomycetota bacterium]
MRIAFVAAVLVGLSAIPCEVLGQSEENAQGPVHRESQSSQQYERLAYKHSILTKSSKETRGNLAQRAEALLQGKRAPASNSGSNFQPRFPKPVSPRLKLTNPLSLRKKTKQVQISDSIASGNVPSEPYNPFDDPKNIREESNAQGFKAPFKGQTFDPAPKNLTDSDVLPPPRMRLPNASQNFPPVATPIKMKLNQDPSGNNNTFQFQKPARPKLDSESISLNQPEPSLAPVERSIAPEPTKPSGSINFQDKNSNTVKLQDEQETPPNPFADRPPSTEMNFKDDPVPIPVVRTPEYRTPPGVYQKPTRLIEPESNLKSAPAYSYPKVPTAPATTFVPPIQQPIYQPPYQPIPAGPTPAAPIVDTFPISREPVDTGQYMPELQIKPSATPVFESISDVSSQMVDSSFNSPPDFYFTIFGGWSELDALNSQVNTDFFDGDHGGTIGLALGRRNGRNLRTEVEVSGRSNNILDFISSSGSSGITGDIDSVSGMANIYWEMVNAPSRYFKPYIGAGVGFVSINHELLDATGSNLVPLNGDNDTSLAYQAMAGVNYKAYRNVDLFAEYRFFQADSYRLESLGSQSGRYDYTVDNVLFGFRWKF